MKISTLVSIAQKIESRFGVSAGRLTIDQMKAKLELCDAPTKREAAGIIASEIYGLDAAKGESIYYPPPSPLTRRKEFLTQSHHQTK